MSDFVLERESGAAPPSAPEADAQRADPSHSTVGEIVSWLVGHPMEAVERELILQTLRHCDGDRVWASGVLGVSVSTLQKKIRSYRARGIEVPGDRKQSTTPVRVQSAPVAHEPPPPVSAEPVASAVVPVENDHEPAAANEEIGPPREMLESAPPAMPAPKLVPAATPETLAPARETPTIQERRKLLDLRVVSGATVSVLALLVTGAYLLGGGDAVVSLFGREPPPAQIAVAEKPPAPASLITEPARIPRWPARFASLDLTADTRSDSTPAFRTVSLQAPMPARPSAVDTAQDSRMDAPMVRAPQPRASAAFAAVNIAADTRMDAAPPPSPAAAFAGINIALDTRMDPAPPRAPAAAFAGIDIAQDTRMEPAPVRLETAALPEGSAEDSEITGAIEAAAPLAPPVPLARPEQIPPAKQEVRRRPVQTAQAPAQARSEAAPPPLPFPLFLFVPPVEQSGSPASKDPLLPPPCCRTQ